MKHLLRKKYLLRKRYSDFSQRFVKELGFMACSLLVEVLFIDSLLLIRSFYIGITNIATVHGVCCNNLTLIRCFRRISIVTVNSIRSLK